MPDPKSYWFDPDVIFGSGISCAKICSKRSDSATDPYKKTKKNEVYKRASEQAIRGFSIHTS